ncbi:hypothetical protein Scep_010482 [Stephania cephalantha]|uniref:F-box associated beta-propeller type 1 domain-containing protein n=1 Tax=Stephania cephalantha TaxID=152367 RepID=A0AAP0PHA4_9MAGN
MWKTIEGSGIHAVFDDSFYVYNSNGIFARGAVHWLVSFLVTPPEEEDRIIAFDFGCEEFRTIPMPDRLMNNNGYKRLSAWGESICLFIKDCREWSSHVFVMKEYLVGDSWCKLYTIPEAPIPPIPEVPERNPCTKFWKIVCFIDDQKILLEQEGLCYLVLYDTRSCKFVELVLHEDLKNVLSEEYSACAYVPSLVPIYKDNYCHGDLMMSSSSIVQLR